MKGQDTERLVGVLAHWTSLVHLNLRHNQFGDDSTGTLAEVVVKCPALTHLNLSSKMTSIMKVQDQEDWKQCWLLAKLWFTLISDGVLNGSDGTVRLDNPLLVPKQCKISFRFRQYSVRKEGMEKDTTSCVSICRLRGVEGGVTGFLLSRPKQFNEWQPLMSLLMIGRILIHGPAQKGVVYALGSGDQCVYLGTKGRQGIINTFKEMNPGPCTH